MTRMAPLKSLSHLPIKFSLPHPHPLVVPIAPLALLVRDICTDMTQGLALGCAILVGSSQNSERLDPTRLHKSPEHRGRRRPMRRYDKITCHRPYHTDYLQLRKFHAPTCSI